MVLSWNLCTCREVKKKLDHKLYPYMVRLLGFTETYSWERYEECFGFFINPSTVITVQLCRRDSMSTYYAELFNGTKILIKSFEFWKKDDTYGLIRCNLALSVDKMLSPCIFNYDELSHYGECFIYKPIGPTELYAYGMPYLKTYQIKNYDTLYVMSSEDIPTEKGALVACQTWKMETKMAAVFGFKEWYSSIGKHLYDYFYDLRVAKTSNIFRDITKECTTVPFPNFDLKG